MQMSGNVLILQMKRNVWSMQKKRRRRAATDYGILTVARIAETMNLPGISYEIAKTVKNKYLIRKKISQNKELQFFELDTEEKALQLREQIRYPVIVKPCDGSGSKGVEKVENREGLLEAFQEAYRFSKSKKVLVEDFFVGKKVWSRHLRTRWDG